MTDLSEDEIRDWLAAAGMDGPRALGGSPFLMSHTLVAVCLRSGAMVLLGDPMERNDEPPIERGVLLHWQWHQAEEG